MIISTEKTSKNSKYERQNQFNLYLVKLQLNLQS